MRSTFHGLETARRGIMTQQAALQTTGHNIANANTPGYSRQRVNFTQTEPYPAAAMNRPHIPGQMGTGVEAGSIERVRDKFIDLQYRNENNKSGYWDTKAEALARMEEIMNEPSEDGLAKTLDQFWESLEDLAVNPTDSGARSVVRQRGIAVADTFNYLHRSLTELQSDLKNEIDFTVDDINSLARQLNRVNQQIAEVEPHGDLPNDLYDERDRLLDELSELVDINIEYESSGGHSSAIAEGKVSVYLGENKDYQLVDGKNLSSKQIDVEYDDADDELVTGIKIDGKEISVGAELENLPIGKLRGLIEMNGYTDGDEEYGVYPEMIDNLDKMAYEFANAFNEVHTEGHTLKDIKEENTEEDGSDQDFFKAFENGVTDAAKLIQLDEDILAEDGLDLIAAAENPVEGDGGNALQLANVKNERLEGDDISGTLQGFYEGIIGEMAVQAEEANNMSDNSSTLKLAADKRRQSISGVSLDEELINMVRFQQAYNASARAVTVVDEMLDRIINNMGLVGR